MTRGPHLDLSPELGDEGPESRGVTPLDWARFVLGAARRHVLLTAVIFLAGVGASVAYYANKPAMYRVETKILAQRQQAQSSVVRPTLLDDPARTAWEIIHRRDNLIAPTQQAVLLEGGGEGQPADAAASAGAFRGGEVQDPEATAMNQMVLRLDRALSVMTEDGTITIQIDWPDPQQAYHLVEAALQNFLEARHVQEITALDEVISLLQGRTATLREQLDEAIAQADRRPVRVPEARAAAPAVPRGPGEELTRLKSMLDAKERAIQDVEEFRRRRLADLQAQLDQMRGIYSDAYPGVINLRQEIASISRESPQVTTLREEERRLRSEYQAKSAGQVRSTPTNGSSNARTRPGEERDEAEERIREARGAYLGMVERVNSAQLELDAARAAFKYRYNLIWPAQMPKKPVGPNPAKIIGAGTFASLLLALGFATLLEIRAGRVVARWQLEHQLDLPVLAEIGKR